MDMGERPWGPGRGGVRVWAVLVVGAVAVWAEPHAGVGVRLSPLHNATTFLADKGGRAAGGAGTGLSDFGELPQLGRDFLLCSERRIVKKQGSRKTSSRQGSTRTCGRSPSVTTILSQSKTVGECNQIYEMDKGHEVKFMIPRSSKSCEMIFRPKAGLLLSFKCKKFRTAPCRKEYLFVADGVSPPRTFCGRRKPRRDSDLTQLYLRYERRRRGARKSRIICTIKATGGGGGGGSGGGASISSQGRQAPNCASKCGAAISDAGTMRIVGGTEAQVGEYRWMAMLTIEDGGPPKSCGGAIITSRQVLTAAHCLDFPQMKVEVVVGQHNVKDFSDKEIRVLTVEKFVMHPDFDRNTLANDVAVLTLDGDLSWSKRVGPLCLSPDKDYENLMGVVTGWGTLSFQGDLPNKMQEVSVQITNHEECVRDYQKSYIDVLDTNVCAASPGKDACQGDSGGPLVMLDKGIWYQIGIVSYGIGCAKPDYPGVYTRVSSYVTWILNQISSSC